MIIKNIRKESEDNNSFRQILWTGRNSQLVLMSIGIGKEIGTETHDDVDQLLFIQSGLGKADLNGEVTEISDGSVIIVPSGTKHNIINTGESDLKLYTVYSPPEH